MSSVKFDNKIPQAIDKIRSATKRALTIGSSFVEARASENAPVDTNRLRGSITNVVYDNYALIGTNVEYAPYVEFGTGIYAEKGGGRKTPWLYEYDGNKGKKGLRLTYGIKAQPYLRPALDNNRQKIKQIMALEYEKGLK